MRFWLTVAIFAVLNATAWLGLLLHARAESRDHANECSYQPGEHLDPGKPLWWRFDRDMAVTDLTSAPPARLSAGFAGVWGWRDHRFLTFSPTMVPRASALTITFIPDRLQAVDGSLVRPPQSLRLLGDPFEVLGCREVDRLPDGGHVLEVDFSDRVDPAQACAHLSVSDRTHASVAVSRFGDTQGALVRVVTPPLEGCREADGSVVVTVAVAAGWSGESGPIPLMEPFQQTLVLDRALRVESVSADGPSAGPAEITLSLNRPCDADRLARVVSVEPHVVVHIIGSGSSCQLAGDFTPGTRYTVVISAPPPGLSGDFPQVDRLPVVIPDRTPSAWFEHTEGYLGAHGARRVLAHAINLRQLRVTAWRLYDSNLVSWQLLQHWDLDRLARPVAQTIVPTSQERNQVLDLSLALDALLPVADRTDGVYRLELSWNSEDETINRDDDAMSFADSSGYGHAYHPYHQYHAWYDRTDSCVISLSDLALQVRQGDGQLDAFVASLATTAPVAEAHLRLYSSKQQLLAEGDADRDGHAHLVWSACSPGEQPAVLLGSGSGAAPGLTWMNLLAPGLSDPQLARDGRAYLSHGQEAFVYAERGVYRPGETAHLRALVRGVHGQVPAAFPLQWRILRPDRRSWRTEMAVAAQGDLSLDLPLPSDLPTGTWTVEVAVPGEDQALGETQLAIEDFTPQRLRASLSLPAGRVHPVRVHATLPLAVAVQADYLFGAPGAGLSASCTAHLQPARFTAASHADWTFNDDGETRAVIEHLTPCGQRLPLAEVRLDAHGGGTWPLAVLAHLPPERALAASPWELVCLASVLEPGGRALSTGSRSLIVDALESYCGLRLADHAVAGETVPVELCALTPDGQDDASGVHRLTQTLYREGWSTQLVRSGAFYSYASLRELTAVQPPSHPQLRAGHGQASIRVGEPGSFLLRLVDETTGQVVSRAIAITAPGETWCEDISRQHPDRCEIAVSPRAESPPPPPPWERQLRVGAIAQITVRAPFNGRVLMTVETDHVLDWRWVELPAGASATTLELPVTADWLPGVHLTATVVRAVLPGESWRLHRVVGMVRIPVRDALDRLDLHLEGPGDLAPGAELPLALRISRPDGRPARDASLTIAVVDEGVLSLTGFTTPDPWAFFNAQRHGGVASRDAFDELLPELAAGGTSTPGGDDALALSRYRAPLPARRTHPMSWWSGVLHCDARGGVQASLPIARGFAGRLKVMVVADEGLRCGACDREVTVHAPLVVQSTWPQCACRGDHLRVPVTVFNHDTQAQTVALRLDAEHGCVALDAATPALLVPAMGSASTYLELQVLAADAWGVVRVLAQGQGLAAEDDAELMIRPPAPTITLGDEIAVDAAHPGAWSIPGQWTPGTLTVSVRLAPRPALALPQGLDRLYRYPYGCAEQTVSANFPLLMLRDLAVADPERFPPAGVASRLASGICHLQLMQTEDGGIAMWPGERAPWPWASVYAAHFLVAARGAGVAVPEELLSRLLGYLHRLGDHLGDSWLETQAYGCYVLALAGMPHGALMHRLEGCLESAGAGSAIEPGTRFLLSAAYAVAGRRDLALGLLPSRVPRLDPASAPGEDLGTPVRERALMLSTLLRVAPDHPEIPLLAHDLARSERWTSTQDTAMALLALGEYLRRERDQDHVPATVVRLSVDGADIGPAGASSCSWSGGALSTLRATVLAPAAGTAWLSWTLSGVPLAPLADGAHGLSVTRRWSTPAGAAVASLTSGTLLLVELQVHSQLPLRQVVVEDLLPGGIEVENPRLRGSALLQDQPAAGAWGVTPQEEDTPDLHLDLRQDRVVVVGNLRQRGDGSWGLRYRYLARAVVPGRYTLPAVRAEGMYDARITAASGAGMVTIEPRP